MGGGGPRGAGAATAIGGFNGWRAAARGTRTGQTLDIV